MKLYQMADPVRYARMTTDELRETFLLEDLFKPGQLDLAYVDLERTVIGSAVPTNAPLKLESQPELRSEYFLERRELGVFNVGGPGTITVDGTSYDLGTLLAPGSNWNTMPPHTHMRRSEIYFYFDVDPAHRIVHLMGPPDATKHLIMSDKQVVVSPAWSVHAGVGTKNYGFVWGMGGENQAYDDMDPAPITSLK